jgi:hypothetical protein
VTEANQSEVLQDLSHSFGCDDPDLKILPKTLSEAALGKQLKKYRQPSPFSQPQSKIPQLLDPEDTLSSSMEWIEALYSVIETHFPSFSISKEIYFLYRVVPGNRNWQIEIADWIWPVSSSVL